MLRTFFTVTFCLSLLVSGCYAPRRLDSLSKEHWPEKATAILPVTTAAIQNDYGHIPSEEVAQVANTVLNTETTWTNNKLMGPAKLESIL